MFNPRYIFRLTFAFLARFKVLILLGIAIGIAFFFLIKLLVPIFSGASLVKIGLTGRFNTNNLPQNILALVGEGLTQLDPTGNVAPDLAERWETPDKGKTWIFTLRQDAVWQDGKKVISNNIDYQFSDVTVEFPDERTIIFKLLNPYSAFPAIVARPTFKKGLLGTGEWEVKNITLSGSFVERLTLQKVGNNKEKILYKFYPTEERTKLAFQLGEVDRIDDIHNPEPFFGWKRAKIETTNDTGEYIAVFFNTKDQLLADKSIRQALSYAIKKDELPGERAISPISVDSWAYNPQVKPYAFDPDKAKEVLNDYKKQSQTDEVIIELSTAPLLLTQAESIARDWEAVGVKVELQVTANIPQEYQAFLAIFDVPEDPDQYTVWHSTQTSTNITRYEDPRIDKLLEDGRTEIDSEARRKIYLDFQRFLVEDSPAAFLYYPTTYSISRR
jgi:peptide/nickel transport system substrate-binding protein